MAIGLNLQAATHEVRIERFAFHPAEITVFLGDEIVFTNLDRAPHNVIARENSPAQFDDSVVLNTGDSFTLEITIVDQILAHCGVHPRMPGIVINVLE